MNYLLFFLLISLVNCKGCKDQCECPDLLDKLDWPGTENSQSVIKKIVSEDRSEISYTEGAGCFRNISCVNTGQTFVQFAYAESEIARPDDADDNYGVSVILLHTGWLISIQRH